jgi:hypothetical protein
MDVVIYTGADWEHATKVAELVMQTPPQIGEMIAIHHIPPLRLRVADVLHRIEGPLGQPLRVVAMQIRCDEV